MDAYGDEMQVDDAGATEQSAAAMSCPHDAWCEDYSECCLCGRVPEDAMTDAAPKDAAPNPARLAMASGNRGMIKREDGRLVRVATKKTKEMFEARSVRPGMSKEQRQAEVEASKQEYLRRYGIRDETTGEFRFPDIRNPRDQAALLKTRGVLVMTPAPQQRHVPKRGGAFGYPKELRKLLDPKGRDRIPIDRQVYGAVMGIEKQALATRTCMLPLINLAIPTPLMATYLVDVQLHDFKDSFDIFNTYHACLEILTSGFRLDPAHKRLAFLDDERIQEIKILNAKAPDLGWPAVEKALSMPRGDLPAWFLQVLRQAVTTSPLVKGHFLFGLKERHPELAAILVQGRKMTDEEAERVLVPWVLSAHYDMIGRTQYETNQLCTRAYAEHVQGNKKLTARYMRELYRICEQMTWSLLTAYDLTFLRLLARYVPFEDWDQFAPRYERVGPELLEPWQAAAIRKQREQVAARRAHFLPAVPAAAAASSPTDLVWPQDPSSPSWSDMAQYHCFLLCSFERDGEMSEALGGIHHSVGAPKIEDSGKEPAPKRDRAKEKQ